MGRNQPAGAPAPWGRRTPNSISFPGGFAAGSVVSQLLSLLLRILAAHLLLAVLGGHSSLTCPERPLRGAPRDTSLEVWKCLVCIAAKIQLGGALQTCLGNALRKRSTCFVLLFRQKCRAIFEKKSEGSFTGQASVWPELEPLSFPTTGLLSKSQQLSLQRQQQPGTQGTIFSPFLAWKQHRKVTARH